MARNGNWENKAQARDEIKRRLAQQDNSAQSAAQKLFEEHLTQFLKFQKGRWGAYRPLRGEISPLASIQNNQHLRWVFPRVVGDTLEFYLDSKQWLSGPFGIEEPDPSASEQVGLDTLDGILVPGLAFDSHGTRLGRGRGFFDRALSQFEGLKVGVAFGAQIVAEALPREPFDVPMDLIITDRGLIYSNRKGDRNHG